MSENFSYPTAEVIHPPAMVPKLVRSYLRKMRRGTLWSSMLLVTIFLLIMAAVFIAMKDRTSIEYGPLTFMGGVLLVLLLLPATMLLDYSSALAKAYRTGAMADLEQAWVRQHRFWRLIGVLCILIMLGFFGLYLFSIIQTRHHLF
jgi:hypothetical protein